MKTISASEFKTHCFAVLREVHSTREPVLITKYGKPAARLMPAGKPDKFIGRLKGKIKIVGDIVFPIVPPEDWTYDLDNLGGEPRT
jgi:prevent-host-death family protein